MKKHHTLLALSISLALFTGCNDTPSEQNTSANDTAEVSLHESEISESENESIPVVQSTTTLPATTSETICTTTTTADEHEDIPTETEPLYDTRSTDSKPIDFTFIEDYHGTSDPADCGTGLYAAIQELMSQEVYKNSADRLSPASEITAWHGDSAPDISRYFDEKGTLTPVFTEAFQDDFNNDTLNEQFIILEMPCYLNEVENDPLSVRYFLVFVNANGEAECVGRPMLGYRAKLLNYGLCKHLAIEGYGVFSYENESMLIGVHKNKSDILLSGRYTFDKWNCFVVYKGNRSEGGVLFYDTGVYKYRSLYGEHPDLDEIYRLDVEGVLPRGEVTEIQQYGESYFVATENILDEAQVFRLTENGFVQDEECLLRLPTADDAPEPIIMPDMEQVIDGMLSPEETNYNEINAIRNGDYELTEISPDNIFIDFEYKDVSGTRDHEKIQDIVELARTTLNNDEEYKDSYENWNENAVFDRTEDSDLTPERFTDENGKLYPLFDRAFIDDYDMDGKSDAFIFFNMPYTLNGEYWIITHTLVFVNGNGECFVPERSSYYSYSASIMDYGLCKQLVIHGAGTCGADTHSAIYGVVDGKPRIFCNFRGEYSKYECFVSSVGWQASGDLMYYDTVAQEYRSIAGDLIDLDEIIRMDSTGVMQELIKQHFEFSSMALFPPQVSLVGGKYYVVDHGMMDVGSVYTYEDGQFIPCGEDCLIRIPGYSLDKAVKLDSYDDVINSMVDHSELHIGEIHHITDKSVMLTTVSPDNIFVDFEIKDGGTENRIKYAEYISAAESAFRNSELYSEHTSLYSPDEKAYDNGEHIPLSNYTDGDGGLKVEFHKAFVDDFSGDGLEDYFVLFRFPMSMNIEGGDWFIRYCLVYVDGTGTTNLPQNAQYLTYQASVLDYGLCKQLVIHGGGALGFDTHSAVYGIRNGLAEPLIDYRGGFQKWKCFLACYGYQSSGGLAYYDTIAQEYRCIVGEKQDMDKMKAMDSTGVLSNYFSSSVETEISLVGGKYYLAWGGYMDTGKAFTYENGAFVPCGEDCLIRLPGYCFSKAVKLNDIQDIIDNMVKPGELSD